MAEKNMNAKISVEFEETANRQQLSSGDNLPTLFGKIKKFFTDLKPVALSGSYNDLTDTPDTSNLVSKSGDVMEGILIAQSNADYTIAQVRNVTMSTEAASGGSNGQIHYQYE